MKRAQLIANIFENMSAMRRLMWNQSQQMRKVKNAPSMAQLGALMALSHQTNLGVKDLAQCSGMTSSAATQLVNGLVRSGWVTRKAVAGDRRKVALQLSLKGKLTLRKLTAERAAIFAKKLSVLSDSELEQLKAIQEKIIAS